MVTRIRYTYEVSLFKDSIPGWNNQPEDFQDYLENHLRGLSHYHPTVVYMGEESNEEDLSPDHKEFSECAPTTQEGRVICVSCSEEAGEPIEWQGHSTRESSLIRSVVARAKNNTQN